MNYLASCPEWLRTHRIHSDPPPTDSIRLLKNMGTGVSRIRPCEPDILDIRSGEVMAVTPRDHPYRIGVTGWTEDEARRRFVAEFAAWQELRDRALLHQGPHVCACGEKA